MSIPKIGADPEVFLWDKANKHFVSAANYFPGTKKEPYKVDKGAIQVDGVALEFNIDAASNEDEFLNNIVSVHSTMANMVKEVNPDWEIRHVPYARFSKEVWDNVAEEHKELGCDPDYCCYNGAVNPNPSHKIEMEAERLKVGAIRTASGHVHIGFCEEDVDTKDPLHQEDCRYVANYFNMNNWAYATTQDEFNRLQFYGANGAYRPKKYGVELRSASNTWLGPNGLISERSVRAMYQNTIKLFQKMESAANVQPY